MSKQVVSMTFTAEFFAKVNGGARGVRQALISKALNGKPGMLSRETLLEIHAATAKVTGTVYSIEGFAQTTLPGFTAQWVNIPSQASVKKLAAKVEHEKLIEKAVNELTAIQAKKTPSKK